MFPKFQNYFEEDEFYYTIRKEAFITFKNLLLKGEREKHSEEEEDTESSPQRANISRERKKEGVDVSLIIRTGK